MRTFALALVLAALAPACKKTEPRNLSVDAGDQLRPRPQELAYVTLKVVGMT
ncbi:MAG TPA: hypothetical protein VM261_35150 [Kofleriaceae bacterium]|nr:hypothetical protein [Kofleriaceae bacterium]